MSLNSKKSEGFVLPYVLCVVFILSLVTISAVDRLQNTTETVMRIQERLEAQQALFTAESDAVFSVISGITTNGGIDLNPQSTPLDLFSIDETESPVEQDIWLANGQWRKSKTTRGIVYIRLQDAAGLIALNNLPESKLLKAFKFLGLNSDKAKVVTARLLDYTDENKTRRFRGAERADYALSKQIGPFDSPIRNHAELKSILGWDEFTGDLSEKKLKEFTTLRLAGAFRYNFAKQPLLEIMSDKDEMENLDGFDILDLERTAVLPSDYSRLTLIYPYASGGYVEKAIEIRRQVNNVDAPFKTFWVYEDRSSYGDMPSDIKTSNLKNAIHATSSLSE